MIGWIMLALSIWFAIGVILFTTLGVYHGEETKLKRMMILSSLLGGPFLTIATLVIELSNQYNSGNISKKLNDWLEGK